MSAFKIDKIYLFLGRVAPVAIPTAARFNGVRLVPRTMHAAGAIEHNSACRERP